MINPLEIKTIDRNFYRDHLADFLPPRIIDIHTHVWLKSFTPDKSNSAAPAVTWPSLVAPDNAISDLLESYHLLLPDQQVTPLIFSHPDVDLERGNDYIAQAAREHNLPALLFSQPDWSADHLEKRLRHDQFLGVKCYYNFAPACIPRPEIRIFDFIPPHQLDVLDKLSALLMLHIPRSLRLRDPLNLHQILEIEHRYPRIKLIIAHVGRAYCPEDIGNAFDILADTRHMFFDFSANTNQLVFEKLIDTVGPRRILFGSDMPITRMRMRRICENGNYINLVPPGLYGDISGDPNMRTTDPAQADKLTLFLYEQLHAFRCAARTYNLSPEDINAIFYHNADRLITDARRTVSSS